MDKGRRSVKPMHVLNIVFGIGDFMWTLIIKKADSTIAGYMSTETTRENLGNYPEDDYYLKFVDDADMPQLGAGQTQHFQF